MSSKLIFNKKSHSNEFIYFEKAWWTSSFTFFFSQLFDIQYYDLRLNVIFWILISGLIVKLQETDEQTESLPGI